MKNVECSLLSAAALVVLLLTGRAAAAAESPAREPSAASSEIVGFELSVARTKRAEDCPDAPGLSSATARLGTGAASPEGDTATALLVTQVIFDRDDAGYFAEIRSTGRKNGVRVVRSAAETCAPLAEATAVVLAVLLDLLPAGAGEPAPAPVAAPSPVNTPPARPSPAPAAKRSLVLALGVDAGLAAGLLEHVAAGALGAAFRPSYGPFELGVGALWAPTRNFAFKNGSVDVMLLGARITGCGWVTPLASRLGFAVCAGTVLGSLHAEGNDFDRNGSRSQFWPIIEAGIRGKLVLNGYLALRLGITALVPLRHLTFSVERLGVAYETPSPGGLFELGPELRFE